MGPVGPVGFFIQAFRQIPVQPSARFLRIRHGNEHHAGFGPAALRAQTDETQIRNTHAAGHIIDQGRHQLRLLVVERAQKQHGQMQVFRMGPSGGQPPGLQTFLQRQQPITDGRSRTQGEEVVHGVVRRHRQPVLGIKSKAPTMPTMSHLAIACLDTWLDARLKPETRQWLHSQMAAVDAGDHAALGLAFGAAGRRAGHDALALTPAEQDAARRAYAGWHPDHWTMDQAVRARLVLAIPEHDASHWLHTVERLFSTASVEELIALYQTLPLMPFPELLRERAAEGVRSSMQTVFAAVALDNPFPAAQLDLDAFNQMVLKAFFLGVDIDRIHDLRPRANHDLTRMLCGYARERRAASRPLDPRLWQVVGWQADDEARQALAWAQETGSVEEQAMARSALAQAASAEG